MCTLISDKFTSEFSVKWRLLSNCRNCLNFKTRSKGNGIRNKNPSLFKRSKQTIFRKKGIGMGSCFQALNYISLSLIHISEPTRQAEISYAVFCLKKKT